MSHFQHKANFICNNVVHLKASLQFIFMLQRMKVSPKGLTFARCASGGTTSLAARSVALWLVAHRLALVYSHLYGILLLLLFLFASAVLCSSLASFCLVGLHFVI